MTVRKMRRVATLLCVAPLFCSAQLTTKQKINDFRQVSAFFARNYAPSAWKKQVFGFDLFDTAPWLERVANSTDDIEFVEICTEYVASLNDSHSSFKTPATWAATMGFTVDNYDATATSPGHILIDNIDRNHLPAGQYPFQVGDRLLSVDGIGVEDWIQRLSKWTASSNSRSKRSMAAQGIVARTQSPKVTQAPFPRGPLETGNSSIVEIQRQSGAIETYTLKWVKSGIPLLNIGPVNDGSLARTQPLGKLSSIGASVSSPGSVTPIFSMPPGFQQRLGKPGDFFFTGTFTASGLRIGYLRIPGFVPQAGPGSPPQPDSAGIAQLAPEIAYFQANTDALVVDIMHNPGGSPPYGNAIYSYLSPKPFYQELGAWRPTLGLLGQFTFTLQLAQASSADPGTIAFYQSMLQQMQTAYAEGAALTPAFPATGTSAYVDPAKDSQGNILAYTKPIMLLTDDFSVSAADDFAAIFQDNQRGIIFGIRTNGGGGAASVANVGLYSSGQIGAEINVAIRNHVVSEPGYPATTYFDSVGVWPDIIQDPMTRDNLLNQGATFSQAMVAAITKYAAQGH
ncbi:MAG TPA: S41 family peptidase [Bryobacteraceae bacterium]|nr:S41 family peptidase [Bryobacteraceae bacterium]